MNVIKCKALCCYGDDSMSLSLFISMYIVLLGLDPARPYFTDGILDHMDGLTKEDAEFVDVIHTNSGKIVEVNYK